MTKIEKRIHPLPLVIKNQEAGMKQELSCRRSTFNSWAIKKMEKDFLSNACFVTSQRQKLSTQQQKIFKSGKRAVFERAQLFFQNHELRARAARFEGRSG